MKYLVMECHTGYAVLLDEKGRFVKAANFQYETGQTVEDPVIMKDPVLTRRKMTRVVMRMAAAAACLFLLFGSYYRNFMLSDTAIYLTINPSVCIELNRRGDVVRLSGANEDGVKLLENYKRSSNDRLVVMDELINRAMEMGYLSTGGLVTIDIDAPDEVRFQKYNAELQEQLAGYLGKQLTVDIQITDHDVDMERPDPDLGPAQKETVTEPQNQKEEAAPSGTPQTPAQEQTAPPKEQSGSTDYGADYEPDSGETDYEKPDDGSDYGSDYEKTDGGSDYESSNYGSDYGSDYSSSDYE